MSRVVEIPDGEFACTFAVEWQGKLLPIRFRTKMEAGLNFHGLLAYERGERPLSPVRLRVLEFIRSYVAREGRSPLHSEIAGHVGLRASSLPHILDSLASAGFVTRHREPRGIRLIDPPASDARSAA